MLKQFQNAGNATHKRNEETTQIYTDKYMTTHTYKQ